MGGHLRPRLPRLGGDHFCRALGTGVVACVGHFLLYGVFSSYSRSRPVTFYVDAYRLVGFPLKG